MTASMRPTPLTSCAMVRVCSTSARSPTTTAAPRLTRSSTAVSRSRVRTWMTTAWPSSSSVSAARRPRPSAEPVMKTRAISERQQHLCCAPLVHRLVPLGRLLEREGEIEDLAWVDLPVPDQLDEIREEAADGGGAAVEVDFREEEAPAVDRHAVADADEADVPAGARGVERLRHRLLGADSLDHRVGAEPVRELLDARNAFVASFLDDVGSAVEAGEFLALGMPGHRDDP